MNFKYLTKVNYLQHQKITKYFKLKLAEHQIEGLNLMYQAAITRENSGFHLICPLLITWKHRFRPVKFIIELNFINFSLKVNQTSF